MRDVDFLPEWYPAIQRRHRMVIVQAWATAVVLIAMVGYAGAKRLEVRAAEHTNAGCEAQVTLSKQQLAQLNQKEQYEDQLKHQDEIVARLGLNVDATRMLAVIEDAMTPEMVLTGVSMQTVEIQPAALNPPVRRRGVSEIAPQAERRLMVKIDGFAPTDVDTATLTGRLTDIKFVENVALGRLQEGRTRDGHIVREFEVTFEVNLTSAEGK